MIKSKNIGQWMEESSFEIPIYQGLGLYLTKRLVTLMNGTISLRSKGENMGSTFTCKIPIEFYFDHPIKM